MKIGELASRSGCSVQTIRYYEKQQLLPAPSRSEGNFRLYSHTIFEQLMFIKRCRSLDLTLDEIRELNQFKASPDKPCDDINAIIEEHLIQVKARISELKSLQTQLLSLREACAEDRKVGQCGILQELSQSS